MKQAEERIGTEMFASFWRYHGHHNPQSDVLGVRNRSGESRIVACMFTKGQVERWRAYWDLLTSGNCCEPGGMVIALHRHRRERQRASFEPPHTPLHQIFTAIGQHRLRK